MQKRFGIEFPLIHGNAERVPCPDDSFDVAISEYGASIWCDPDEWITEAARLLRPGGELVFLVNSVLSMLCSGDVGPTTERLMRPQFGMHRFEWPDDDSVEFHLPHGEMIALLRRSGFDVEELIEVRPPPDATTRYDLVTLEWSRNGPARRSGGPGSALLPGPDAMEAAGTAPASAKDAPMRQRAFPTESISASGSVDPRGTLPAPDPPVDVPGRPRKLPVG